MTIWGFDVDSSNKAGFNFGTAFGQGKRASWIKIGGNNISGNQPYRMSGYPDFASKQQNAGFPVKGDYWMVGGHDPVGAARFLLANQGNYGINAWMLDNEKIDSGNLWNDNECCAFFDTLHNEGGVPYSAMWMYGSRDATWNTQTWPGCLARSIKAWVAIYNNQPFVNCYPQTYPSALVKGHQYTSSESMGGISNVDADAFTDDAFTAAPPITPVRNDTMSRVIGDKVTGQVFHLSEAGWIKYITNDADLQTTIKLIYGAVNRNSDGSYADLEQLEEGEFIGAIREWCLDEYSIDQVRAMKNNVFPAPPELHASWADARKATPVSWTPTPDQLQTIIAGISAGLNIPTADQNGAAARAAIVK